MVKMRAYNARQQGPGLNMLSVGETTPCKQSGCCRHLLRRRRVGMLCLLVVYCVLLLAIYIALMPGPPIARSVTTTPIVTLHKLSSLVTPAPLPATATGSPALTSALKSTYSLVGGEPNVGDTVHISIEAKDALGRHKSSGGDFWLAVLTSQNGTYPTSGGRSAGAVRDHKNGTYSVFFHAGWEGTAYVGISLLLTSHATEWLRESYWPVEKRVFWKGMFLGMNYLENGMCYLLRNTSETQNLCAIHPNPKAMGLTVFYCEKPLLSKCDDFKKASVSPPGVEEITFQLLQKNVALFKGRNYSQSVIQGPRKIDITRQNVPTPMTETPVCKPDVDHLVNDGFWWDNTWHHLQCKVRRWDDAAAVRSCLRHKHVIVHGDSNVRNWYCLLTKRMGYPWTHMGKGEYKLVMEDYYADSDIEMSFNFHPWVVTTSQVQPDQTPYEVDMLDELPTGACSRTIIVLCPWGHFTQWTRTSYVERTLLLRDAVVRLKERCPDVTIVVKGAHAREHLGTMHTVFASDYTLWAWGKILKDAFRGTGVLFYDVWQMNLAYGQPNMHMPFEVIDEEINWFLTNVCK